MKHLTAMRFFCLLPFLLVPLPLAANGDPRNVIYLSHGNSTSINSNYEASIHSLAAMLRSETSASPGVYTEYVVGDHPDGVHTVSRCRNGTNSSSCRSCLTLALQASRTACPYHRESAFFNGNCSLRLLPAVLVLNASAETEKRNIVNIVMRNLSLAMVFQAIGFAWLFFLLLQDSRDRKDALKCVQDACHLETSNHQHLQNFQNQLLVSVHPFPLPLRST